MINVIVSVSVLVVVSITLFFLFKRVKTIYSSFTDLKGYTSFLNDIPYFTYTPGGITKIIIKTSWHTRDHMPLQMIKTLKDTIKMNPEYTLYYFDHSDRKKFMKEYANASSNIYKIYKKLIPGAFQADLFRLCILEKYGGCYSDIGHILFKPLNKILGDNNIVLVKDIPFFSYFGIHNAFMCSSPSHQFFKKLVNKCCENIKNNYYGDNELDVTGPTMIGKIYNCTFEKVCKSISKNIMKIGTTNFSEANCEYCKVKILDLKFLPLKFKKSFYILENGKIIIQTKFDNYQNVMYGKQPSYKKLWEQRKIYKK